MSTKKKVRFYNKYVKRVLGLLLIFVGSVGCYIFAIIPAPNANNISIIMVWLTILACGLIIFLGSFPSIVGKFGEKRVSKILDKIAKEYKGYLINDVIIPDEDGKKTSQIDHILLTVYGVFVIETKNYSGYIYGSESQNQWTQVLAYGKTKNKFYNPVKQNATHCCRLKSIVNNDAIKLNSLVVLVKNNKGNIESSKVCYLSNLEKIITNNSRILYSEGTITNAFYNIDYYKQNKICSDKDHVKEIKEKLSNIDNLICPRCGGRLILRTSKDGTQFYGCSNYPRCRFTKKS